jgi:hypothetical protein
LTLGAAMLRWRVMLLLALNRPTIRPLEVLVIGLTQPTGL